MARRRARTASPASVLDAVRKDAAAGWPAGLTVLTGDDLYHLDRAQRTILESLAPEGPAGAALSVFGEESVSVGTVVAAARSAAMFAPKRIVLVREVGCLTGEPEALQDYAGSPPPASYLLVRAPELDQRRKLHKALVEAGRTCAFVLPQDADPRDSRAQLDEMAAEREVELDPDAASYLLEVTAGDLYAIRSELDKLQSWLGAAKRRRVNLAQARELVAGTRMLSGWEVADAILTRDRGRALGAVARLIVQGDEPIRMLGGLAWRARTMLQAKALLERGVPGRQVVQATRAWAYQRQLLKGLERYTLDELLAFPGFLLQADRALKSSSVPPRTVLESLIDQLTATERP